jgi:hypothetical protein
MKQILLSITLIALVAVGISIVGCSSPQSQNPQSSQPPAGANAPSAQGPASGQPAQGGGQPGGPGGPGSSGTVKSISGNTIQLTGQDGNVISVKIDDKTTIQKNVSGTLADMQTGVRLIVMGDQGSGTIIARNIQIDVGAASMPSGQDRPQGTPGAGQPGQGGPQGGPSAGQPGQGGPLGAPGGGQPGSAGAPSMGTVKSVSGNSIVLTVADNSTITIKVDDKTTIQKNAAATAADIQAGVQIMAIGETSNGTLTARSIQIGAGR